MLAAGTASGKHLSTFVSDGVVRHVRCPYDRSVSEPRDAVVSRQRLTDDATRPADPCVFCAIAAGRAEASVVHEDDSVVAFMDLNPVTRGHLLVVPRAHAVGLEDLDRSLGAHVWSVGHDLARALRRSGIPCEGVNVLVCDGEAAFQTVFHFHLHVIPRSAGDGWTPLHGTPPQRERALLDADASAVRAALVSTAPTVEVRLTAVRAAHEAVGVRVVDAPVDYEADRALQANLLAVAGPPAPYVEERPEAPWWDGAAEMTLTLVVGARAGDVARVLGLDLAAAEPMLLPDAPWRDDASPLALVEVPGAVAVAEPNGWTTVQPDTVAALSRLGLTVSLYWNVNMHAQLVVADGGTVLRDLDPVLDGGGGVGTPLPEEAGMDWGTDPIAAAAALQARVTGIHLTRGQVFGTPHLTVLVPWPR